MSMAFPYPVHFTLLHEMAMSKVDTPVYLMERGRL